MTGKLLETLQILFWVAFLGLIINGCFHSFKKHKDDPAWLQESPLVIYRGAEYFWHDDFAGVEWNKRIADDIATAFELITYSTESKNIDENKMQMEAFAKKIADYPSDKSDRVKKGLVIFLKFNVTYANDDLDFIKKYLEDSRAEFKYSDITNQYYDTLTRIYNLAEAKMLKNTMDSILPNQKAKFYSIPDSDVQKIYTEVYKSKEAYIDAYHLGYKRIFNEDYN